MEDLKNSRMGCRTWKKKYDNKRHTSSILVYKGSFGWICWVIEYAEQHIQSRECPDHGFVVLGRGRNLKILRWVDGLVKKKGGILTFMGWIISFIPRLWWLCGVIDHAEQHIQSGACLDHGIIMNSDFGGE